MEFRDLKKQYELNKEKFDNAVISVMESGHFIGGRSVSNLEERLADYVGVKHCVSCANGTDALLLVLKAWGIKEGDAVFVPNFTFFASAEVISQCGATPIFVDVDERTFNISGDSLKEAITNVIDEKMLVPKAVITVDLFGLPADYDKLQDIAKKYDLLVLEDSAQGFGGGINSKKSGSFGNASTTSFFPAKPLGCYGDGGAIFTDSDELNEILRSLKVHGKGISKYDNVRIGYNSRLDSIQAAILSVKLDLFEAFELGKVNEIAQSYESRLKDYVMTPYIPNGYSSSFAQYTILLENEELRDHLFKELKANGIPSMVYYTKTMDEQSAFAEIKTYCNLRVSKSLTKRVLSLPMHPYIELRDIERVCDIIINILKG